MNNQSTKKISILLLLGPMVTLGAFAMDLYAPFIPFLQQEFNASAFAIQATVNIFMLVIGCCQIFLGPLSDKYGRKSILMFSSLIYAIGSLFCYLTTEIEYFILARALQALGACGAVVTSYAAIRDCYEGESAQRYFSFLVGITGCAPIVAPLLGTGLANYFGNWKVIFIFLALYSLTGFLMLSFFLKEKVQVQPHKKLLPSCTEINNIIFHSHFKQWFLTPAVVMSGLFLFFATSSHYIQSHLGHSQWEFSIFFSINAILYAGSSFLAPMVLGRLGAYRTIRVGLLMIIFSSLSLIIQSYLGPNNLIWFLSGAYTCCVAYGLIQGAGMGMVLQPFSENVGLVSALVGTVQFTIASLLGVFTVHPPVQSAWPFAFPMLVLSILAYINAYMIRQEQSCVA